MIMNANSFTMGIQTAQSLCEVLEGPSFKTFISGVAEYILNNSFAVEQVLINFRVPGEEVL